MDDQLQELINLQREQNQLLKKYLWRFRFSLLTLLLLMTITAAGLGFLVYQDRARSKATRPPAAAAAGTFFIRPSQGSLSITTDEMVLLGDPAGTRPATPTAPE
jgi:hypothetical protein